MPAKASSSKSGAPGAEARASSPKPRRKPAEIKCTASTPGPARKKALKPSGTRNRWGWGGGKPLTSDSFYGKFLANTRENGVPGLIEPIRGKSVEVARHWDKPIQLLFIDGAHEYEDTKADFTAWEPFLAKGGTIAFHDYELSPCPVYGVTQAVNELIAPSKRFSKLERINSLVWATKIAE